MELAEMNVTRKLGLLTATLACTLVSTLANAQTAPKCSAKVPPYITTPDKVETSIGTLKFFDGLPNAETVQKVYDNLDRARGMEAFLSGIPAASVYAACEGLSEAGVKRNSGNGVFRDLMDARSLFLS